MHLDHYPFGEVINSFRKYKNMSISELAEGICTSDELVSYEKEKTSPTIDILYKLAIKLKIELTYLFEIASKSQINYSTLVIKIIDSYKRERNYGAIYSIIQHEEKNPIFNQILLKQYLLWHKGICIYYINTDLDSAIDTLYEAIEITNPNRLHFTEREIEILTSIATIQLDNENYRKAISIFIEALSNLEKLPFILNSKGTLKILFGLSQSLTEIGHYQESLEYCERGIDLCINEERLYLLNEFHYQLGENYIKMGEYQKGKDHFEQCLYLLKLERKTKLYKIMEKEVEKQLNTC